MLVARSSSIGEFTYVKGSCKKTMKAVQYEVDVKLNKNGTPEESHCECPAGSGTEAKCKHVAVLLYGIQHMVDIKIILLHQVCTQKLQTFHVPKAPFTDSPLAAAKLPKRKPHKEFSPYPIYSLDKRNYNNKIRNLIMNYPNSTMPMKQMYEPANPHAVTMDHTYNSSNIENDFLHSLYLCNVTEDMIEKVEETTRGQTNNPVWLEERKKRITASKFHTICHLKDKTMPSYSKQMLNERPFSSRATTHGLINEKIALEEYMTKFGLNVEPCGLFISKDRPYLSASPDGLLGDETVIEIKCPYAARNEEISPTTVPYLENGRKYTWY